MLRLLEAITLALLTRGELSVGVSVFQMGVLSLRLYKVWLLVLLYGAAHCKTKRHEGGKSSMR